MHDTGHFTANKWRIFLLLIPVLSNSFAKKVQVFEEITSVLVNKRLRGRCHSGLCPGTFSAVTPAKTDGGIKRFRRWYL